MGLAIIQAYLDKIPDEIEAWRHASGKDRAPILDTAVTTLMGQFPELDDKAILQKVDPHLISIKVVIILIFKQALGTYFSNHYRTFTSKSTIPGRKKRSARYQFQVDQKAMLKRVTDERTNGAGIAKKDIGIYTAVVSEFWAKLTDEEKAEYQKAADEFNASAKLVKMGSSE